MTEIRAREQKATKGPWQSNNPADYIYARNPYGHGDMLVAQPRGWGHLTGTGACHLDEHKAMAIQKANADFIAHAREDVPYLLSQLSAQAQEIARLREALTKAKPHCGLCRGKGWRTVTYDDYGMSDPKQEPCGNCARIDVALAPSVSPVPQEGK